MTVGGSAPLIEADADLKIVFENLLVNAARRRCTDAASRDRVLFVNGRYLSDCVQ